MQRGRGNPPNARLGPKSERKEVNHMFTLSPELKRMTMEKRGAYLQGGVSKAVFKCVACAKPLTLEEREKGNRCNECIKLLKK